ncbi:hypothetical protein JN757_00450 [Pseudomonas granadensis]|uniref:Uncharacterized protein n=1 Tax=Pseudomonas granadensis TaxID=1421430 RepID=A0ABX7GGT9_9PSED|nr:hypothetical protein [Pseudomonas granadensis]QRK84282.1 hypothetical protein JN757_00450 [Pseudomonas granadensis]
MELKPLFFAALLGLPFTSAFAAAPALEGHYYLTGAMEMGAELLLRKDGTFDAGVSYGSADGFAKGTWAVENQTVVLKSQTKAASNSDLGGLFQDLELAIEPNCLAVDFGNGKACFRRQ